MRMLLVLTHQLFLKQLYYVFHFDQTLREGNKNKLQKQKTSTPSRSAAEAVTQFLTKKERYMKLKEDHASRGDGEEIDDDDLFIEAAGGWQGNHVYGLGSATSSIYAQSKTGETSTNVQLQSQEWVKKIKDKCDNLEKIVEEQNQLLKTMRAEIQLSKIGQQASPLMPSSAASHMEEDEVDDMDDELLSLL